MTDLIPSVAKRAVQRIERRLELGAETAFTIIELLIVLMVLAILLEMAIPAYLSLQDRAERRAAASSVRVIEPGIALWYADFGTYVGVTPVQLNSRYNLGIDASRYKFGSTNTSASYCVQYQRTGNTYTAVLSSPPGDITVGSAITCP